MTRLTVRDAKAPFRRPTNISLDSAMIEEARELGINISRACEEGLAKQISEERGRRWLEENREAMEAANEWVANHGLPLAKYRTF